MGYIVMFPTSILFGGLRLISKSIWPAFLLHNIVNALRMPLLINGFIHVDGPLGTTPTPAREGILTSPLCSAWKAGCCTNTG